MDSKAKLLIVHAHKDNVGEVLGKVQKLHVKSGPFHSCLVLGNNIAASLQNIEAADMLPLLIFDSDCNDLEPNDCKSEMINDRITVFKGSSVYKLTNGITVGYITYNNDCTSLWKDDIETKFKNVNEIDILVTNPLSKSVVASEKLSCMSNDLIDYLVKKVQPRYHITFGDSNSFMELNPFQWPHTANITRTLNVASFGSQSKWAYAFNLFIDKELDSIPENLIDNPYTLKTKKRLKSDQDTLDVDLKKANPNKKLKGVMPKNCHFCFSNDNLQDHMIISIGTNAYLTIAKGPLTVPTGEITFSGHCLLIPIKHIAKLNSSDTEDMENGNEEKEKDSVKNITEWKLYQELYQYENKIVEMNYRKFDLCTITFEINSSKSIHFHKQIFPVPKYLILKFIQSLDRQCYFNNHKVKGNANLEFQSFVGTDDEEYLKILCDPTSNYMQFTVYESPQASAKIYLAKFSLEKRLDLQFGRRVVAFLLNLPKRIKWDSKTCFQTKEEEMKEVEMFQSAFKAFDPTSM